MYQHLYQNQHLLVRNFGHNNHGSKFHHLARRIDLSNLTTCDIHNTKNISYAIVHFCWFSVRPHILGIRNVDNRFLQPPWHQQKLCHRDCYFCDFTISLLLGDSVCINFHLNLLLNCWFTAGRHQSWGVTIAESFRSEQFSVTWTAMDFLIGTVTGQCWIKWTMALGTIETFLVPHRSLCQLLFGRKYSAATAWTTLSGRCLNWRCIRIVKRFRVCNLIVAKQYHRHGIHRWNAFLCENAL